MSNEMSDCTALFLLIVSILCFVGIAISVYIDHKRIFGHTIKKEVKHENRIL